MPVDTRDGGRIVTFYSYKGGTGRTMALANVAWILASAGRRVLTIDWDLEAPGLHRYFAPFLDDPSLTKTQGLIDFVIAYQEAAAHGAADSPKDWFEDYTHLVDHAASLRGWTFPGDGTVDFVGAGRQGTSYGTRVNTFDWNRFYEQFGGGEFLRRVGERLRGAYDYVLIDSRTGVSDTSGICTVQLPDTVVVLFTMNNQSIEGAAAVAASVRAARPDIRVIPVATRLALAEKEKLQARWRLVRNRFRSVLDPGLTTSAVAALWSELQVPSDPFYGFEEVLAVLADPEPDRLSVLGAMETLTRHVSDGDVPALTPIARHSREEALERYQQSGDEPSRRVAWDVLLAHGPACAVEANDLAERLAPRVRVQRYALPSGGTSEALPEAARHTVVVLATEEDGLDVAALDALVDRATDAHRLLPVVVGQGYPPGVPERLAQMKPIRLINGETTPEDVARELLVAVDPYMGATTAGEGEVRTLRAELADVTARLARAGRRRGLGVAGWLGWLGAAAMAALLCVTFGVATYRELGRRAEGVEQRERIRFAAASRLILEGSPTMAGLVLAESERPHDDPRWVPLALTAVDAGLSRSVLRGHTGPVTALAVDPSHTTVISGGDDRTVRVWRPSGRGAPLVFAPVQEPGQFPAEVREVSAGWRGDQLWLAAEMFDRAWVWAADGPRQGTSPVFPEYPARARVDPDAQLLISWSGEPDLPGPLYAYVPGDKGGWSDPGLPDVQWAALGTGGRLYTIDAEYQLRYGWASGEVIGRVTGPDAFASRGFGDGIFVPPGMQGDRVAWANPNGTVSVWDPANGLRQVVLSGNIPLAALPHGEDAVFVWAADPDTNITGLHVVPLSPEGGFGSPVWRNPYADTPVPIPPVALGDTVAWYDYFGLVHAARLPDPKSAAEFGWEPAPRVWTPATSPDAFAGLVDVGGTPHIVVSRWDAIHVVPSDPPYASVNTPWAAYGPDGALVGFDTQSRVRVWDANGRTVQTDGGLDTARGLPVAIGPGWAMFDEPGVSAPAVYPTAPGSFAQVLVPLGSRDVVAATSDARVVAAATPESIQLWEGAAARTLYSRVSFIGRLALDSGGTRLAVGDDFGALEILDVGDGSSVYDAYVHSQAVMAVAFHPGDNEVVAAASLDGTVSVHLLGDDETLVLSTPGGASFRSVAFSLDGTRLAAGTDDGRVAVWAGKRFEERAIVHAGRGRVERLSFDPDGNYLAASGPDATAVWPVSVEVLADVIARSTNACLTVDIRRDYLLETSDEARASVEDCERQYGRPTTPAPLTEVGTRVPRQGMSP